MNLHWSSPLETSSVVVAAVVDAGVAVDWIPADLVVKGSELHQNQFLKLFFEVAGAENEKDTPLTLDYDVSYQRRKDDALKAR